MSKESWDNSICSFEGVKEGVYLTLGSNYSSTETKTDTGFMLITSATPFYHLVVFTKPIEYCGSVVVTLRQEFSVYCKEEAIEAFNDEVVAIIYGRK